MRMVASERRNAKLKLSFEKHATGIDGNRPDCHCLPAQLNIVAYAEITQPPHDPGAMYNLWCRLPTFPNLMFMLARASKVYTRFKSLAKGAVHCECYICIRRGDGSMGNVCGWVYVMHHGSEP
jgi:hypothetical protein